MVMKKRPLYCMGAGAVMSYPFELILCISFRQTFFFKQTKKKTHPEGLEKRIEHFFFFTVIQPAVFPFGSVVR